MGAVPLPRFSLWLLACFELTGPGDVVDLPGRKTAALLAYLASKSGRQGRSDVTLRQSRLVQSSTNRQLFRCAHQERKELRENPPSSQAKYRDES